MANNPLQVLLILQILQSLPSTLIETSKFAGTQKCTLKKMIKNFNNTEESFPAFLSLIYYFGINSANWALYDEKGNIHQEQIKEVHMLMDFIEDFNLAKTELKKKVLTFWISTVILKKEFQNIHLLCYILYKMELIQDLNIWLIFRHSFIVRCLLFNEIEGSVCCWFENISKANCCFANQLKPWNFIEWIEVFEFWEAKKNNRLILEAQNGNIFTKEKERLKKISTLFEEIYNQMDRVMDEIRSKVLVQPSNRLVWHF